MRARAQRRRREGRRLTQHEPQLPWFLTGVTAPLVLQSTAALASTPGSVRTSRSAAALTRIGVGPSARAAHSACVKSENWFTPRRKE